MSTLGMRNKINDFKISYYFFQFLHSALKLNMLQLFRLYERIVTEFIVRNGLQKYIDQKTK